MKKIIISILILLPIFSFAASTDYTLLEPLPCIQNTGQGVNEQACADGTLIKKINTDTYIAYVFNFSIAFAAVAAVVVITYAGFEYALNDMVTKKSDAKNRIWNAIWGLLTIICSYLILKTIDPRLVDINTQLPVIELKGYKFDYDALVNTAEDYRIKQDLDAARAEIRPLEFEAKLLREEAIKYREEASQSTDPAKTEELRAKATISEQKAADLQKKISFIGARASLKAVSDLQYSIIDEIEGGDYEAKEQQDLIEKRKASISGQADKDIKKMVELNDPQGAQALKEDRDYYLAKLDQDILIKQAVAGTEKLSSDFVITGPGSELAKKQFKERALAEGKKGLAALQAHQIPQNLSPEYKIKLEQEKAEAIKKINDLMTPSNP